MKGALRCDEAMIERQRMSPDATMKRVVSGAS
jgi:hypothetical protein